jgi:hypothetical protein
LGGWVYGVHISAETIAARAYVYVIGYRAQTLAPLPKWIV